MSTSALTRSEVGHARVFSGVHVVVCSTAGIAASRAARGGRGLCQGIDDEVTDTSAAALEGIVQTEPVTSHVSERLQ